MEFTRLTVMPLRDRKIMAHFMINEFAKSK